MTTYDKGTHGVLTNSNSGVTIPATIDHAMASRIFAKIDGVPDSSAIINGFSTVDGWTFEPDLVLPTAKGSVVRVHNPNGKDASWLLLSSGAWISQDGNTFLPKELRSLILRNKFTLKVIV